jgi:hypothetical protein
MTRRTRRYTGGETPSDKSSLGASSAVRPGKSPGQEADTGTTLGTRSGRLPAEESYRGTTLAARRMSTGGSLARSNARDNGAPRNDGRERLALAEKNNDALTARFAKGGSLHNKAQKELHSLYKMLHSHFEGGSEPEVKKKSGGKMWIKGAINPAHKGLLHKKLGVPKGNNIPKAKLHKAEHSKSPTLRREAHLAENLSKLNHRPRGR